MDIEAAKHELLKRIGRLCANPDASVDVLLAGVACALGIEKNNGRQQHVSAIMSLVVRNNTNTEEFNRRIQMALHLIEDESCYAPHGEIAPPRPVNWYTGGVAAV